MRRAVLAGLVSVLAVAGLVSASTAASGGVPTLAVEQARACGSGLTGCQPFVGDMPVHFCCIGHYGTALRIDVQGSLVGAPTTVLRLNGVPWAGPLGAPAWFGPDQAGWKTFKLENIINGNKPRMRLQAGVYDVDLLDTVSGATAAVGVVVIENPPPPRFAEVKLYPLDSTPVRVTRTRGFPPRAGEPFGLHVSGDYRSAIPAGVIYWDGNPLPTGELNAALVATVPADLATAGDHSLQVITPPPGGGASDVVTIQVRPSTLGLASASSSG